MRYKVVIELVVVHFKNFFRQPGALFWSFVFPVAMAWSLGIAFSSTPQQKFSVVCLNDAPTKAYIDSISNKKNSVTFNGVEFGNTTVRFEFADSVNAFKKYSLSQATLILKYDGKNVLAFYDPQNKDAATLFLQMHRAWTESQGVLKTVVVKAKGIRYIDFLIPGLFALGIMNSSVWGMSWYLIELRMKKLLRRMVASPMRKSEFILSHLITRMFLSLIESLILLLFSYLFFDIYPNGALAALLLLYVAGCVAFGGVGLLLGSRTASTYVGNGLINAFVLPMTVLCGVFFGYSQFPEFLIPVIKLLPLTVLSDYMRMVFTQGAGLSSVLLPSLSLCLFGFLCYSIGLRIFKWS